MIVDGHTTLVGIVSGGLGCGNGIPNWYTRVSFYEEWMACILEKSRELKSSDEVITYEENPCFENVTIFRLIRRAGTQ